MNLKEELLREHSKAQGNKIASYVVQDTKRYDELMTIFFEADYRLNQRAAFSINICFDKEPKLITPYITSLIKNLHRTDIHDAVKRNTIRILQFIDIPEEIEGELYDICFAFLISANEPIAIKAFSMRVLANICKSYPELKNELIPVIEDLMTHGSFGIKNRGKKILNELSKL